MFIDIASINNIYVATGYTDMRKAIDGLTAIVLEQFELNPYENSLFLFCGRRRDRMKALYWQGDGFLLLYKRLEDGKYQWPMDKSAVSKITIRELRWLLEGLSVNQPRAVKPVKMVYKTL